MNNIECPKCGCEHTPFGRHEDDATLWECESCGFAFNVDIEYEPVYHTQCVTCEPDREVADAGVTYDVCKYCGVFTARPPQ